MRTLRPFESNVPDANESRLHERENIMSIQEVSAERLAQLFHHYHQVLADDSRNSSHLRTKDARENVRPTENSKLMAAAGLALLEVELGPSERQSRRYFANPGEAEWGC
jgi:hypothetical protein